MNAAQPLRSVAECYAHALLIEREAVQRYTEFAEHMTDHGNEDTARLFRQLARFEAEHARTLERKSADLALPQFATWEYSWLDDGPPETVSHELIFHLMTPHDALKIALAAENRAKAFFEHVVRTTGDSETRELATEMLQEEIAHVRWVEEALAKTPPPIRYDGEEPLSLR